MCAALERRRKEEGHTSDFKSISSREGNGFGVGGDKGFHTLYLLNFLEIFNINRLYSFITRAVLFYTKIMCGNVLKLCFSNKFCMPQRYFGSNKGALVGVEVSCSPQPPASCRRSILKIFF